MSPIYDQIGKTYTATRSADPRITARLIDLLNLPKEASILDVGAGTGNYSQAMAEAGYKVTALEPSEVMRKQGKQHPKLKWSGGHAEALPFEDHSFDGVMMTLCMHHFSDWRDAVREATRVLGSGPIVILSFDAEKDFGFWLFDYFPAFLEQDRKWFPKISEVRNLVEKEMERSFQIEPFPLPKDLIDHFAAASWARPELYLDERYRAGISSFFKVDQSKIEAGLKRLATELSNGTWDQRYGHYRTLHHLDVGYTFLKIL